MNRRIGLLLGCGALVLPPRHGRRSSAATTENPLVASQKALEQELEAAQSDARAKRKIADARKKLLDELITLRDARGTSAPASLGPAIVTGTRRWTRQLRRRARRSKSETRFKPSVTRECHRLADLQIPRQRPPDMRSAGWAMSKI